MNEETRNWIAAGIWGSLSIAGLFGLAHFSTQPVVTLAIASGTVLASGFANAYRELAQDKELCRRIDEQLKKEKESVE